jgi:hypothetical protein
MRLRDPEQRHHSVADMLVDRTAVTRDDGIGGSKISIE